MVQKVRSALLSPVRFKLCGWSTARNRSRQTFLKPKFDVQFEVNNSINMNQIQPQQQNLVRYLVNLGFLVVADISDYPRANRLFLAASGKRI